jgi:hypothetical protein
MSGGLELPLIRLPAPSPRVRGEGRSWRRLASIQDIEQGKSPLPARGERVRVRGKPPSIPKNQTVISFEEIE